MRLTRSALLSSPNASHGGGDDDNLVDVVRADEELLEELDHPSRPALGMRAGSYESGLAGSRADGTGDAGAAQAAVRPP